MNRMQRYTEKLKKYCADSAYRFVVNAALGLYNSMPDRDYLERKFEALMGTPLHLDAPIHAHMMPLEPPDADIANDAHAPWASIWTPDQVRHDSFDDLFALAIARSEELMPCAIGVMIGRVSHASLYAMHGGLSYDSGLPWQETCSPYHAPGVKASKA